MTKKDTAESGSPGNRKRSLGLSTGSQVKTNRPTALEVLEAFTHVTPEMQVENPYSERGHRWWAFQFLNVCRADFVISRETLLSAGTDGPGGMYKYAAAYYGKCVSVCDFLLHHLTATDEERPYSRIKQARMKRESKRARKSGNA